MRGFLRPPTVHSFVVVQAGLAICLRRDDRSGAATIEFGPEPIGVEGFVTEQGVEGDAFDQRRHADRVVALARQQHKAHQIAESIDQGNDLGGQAAARAANGLILAPPFAPLAF